MNFCIIVPYRDRAGHLRKFIPHMTRRFKAPIYIIEQADDKPFNRGKLLNIGFLTFGQNYDYCALHDIDMLPTKADYSAPARPTHLATRVEQFRYQMPSPDYFGGVVLFNRADFIACDGYSNEFWGWGGEDNELYFHLNKLNMAIDRRTCFYHSLYHQPANKHGFDAQKMEQAKAGRSTEDGMCYCKWEEGKLEEHPSYAKLSVLL